MQPGAQVWIAPNWFLGGSIAYESSHFRSDGGIAKANGDSLRATPLRYQNGPWQISGTLGGCQADASAATGGKELPLTRPQALRLA
jgi:hypothetical protein